MIMTVNWGHFHLGGVPPPLLRLKKVESSAKVLSTETGFEPGPGPLAGAALSRAGKAMHSRVLDTCLY